MNKLKYELNPVGKGFIYKTSRSGSNMYSIHDSKNDRNASRWKELDAYKYVIQSARPTLKGK